VVDNQRALDLAQTSYRVGKTDLRDVQQQQLDVYAAKLALLRVQSEQLAQRVNLHLALGGSFETRLALKVATELNSKQAPSAP
jgi:outer membrane protein, multidrug efflux system